MNKLFWNMDNGAQKFFIKIKDNYYSNYRNDVFKITRFTDEYFKNDIIILTYEDI